MFHAWEFGYSGWVRSSSVSGDRRGETSVFGAKCPLMLTNCRLRILPVSSTTRTSKRTVVASLSVRSRNEMPTYRLGVFGLCGSATHISTAIGGSDALGAGAAAEAPGCGVGAA